MSEVEVPVFAVSDVVALDRYKKVFQDLMVRKHKGKITTDNIVSYLERFLEFVNDDPSYASFFRGEKAFSQEHYREALEFYKQARTIPDIEFYCRRTTAFVLNKAERNTEALSFAKRALSFYPNDIPSIELIIRLLKERREDTEAHRWQEEMERSLLSEPEKDSSTPDISMENMSSQAPALDQRELDDLETLFRDIDLSSKFVVSSTTPNMVEKQAPSYPFGNSLKSSSLPFLKLTSADTTQETFEEPINWEKLSLDEIQSRADQAIAALQKMKLPEGRVRPRSSITMLEENFGINIAPSDSLEHRIESFKRKHARRIADYVEKSGQRTLLENDCMYVLSGWDKETQRQAQQEDQKILYSPLTNAFFLEKHRKTTGGIFIRWQNRGIVINPGRDFLDNFHAQNLFINDIDYVIVTRHEPEYFTDLQAIYDLNYQRNTISTDLHVIHYYLNQDCYHLTSNSLKPHFKQERDTLHSLDLYQDSPNVEALSFNDKIAFSYFHQGTSLERGNNGVNVGIRLDLQSANMSVSLGYLSGLKWSPILAAHLNQTDIILAGFEETNTDDYNKLRHNEFSLGYFGTSSLLQEISPRLMISLEFNGQNGDIRMEIVKKLRQEYSLIARNQNTVILPGDNGLFVDLSTLHIRCSVSEHLTPASKIQVCKPCDAFGTLQYLASNCVL